MSYEVCVLNEEPLSGNMYKPWFRHFLNALSLVKSPDEHASNIKNALVEYNAEPIIYPTLGITRAIKFQSEADFTMFLLRWA